MYHITFFDLWESKLSSFNTAYQFNIDYMTTLKYQHQKEK